MKRVFLGALLSLTAGIFSVQAQHAPPPSSDQDRSADTMAKQIAFTETRSTVALTTTGKTSVAEKTGQAPIAQSSTLTNQPQTKNQEAGFRDLFVDDLLRVEGVTAPRLNPRAVSFVEDYMNKHTKDLLKLKEWALPFFNLIDGIMVQNNLPRELKYLAIIESRLNPTSVSWAGAVGPWQFMPATAQKMGLKVNSKVDERVDYVKSTNAAAKYLKELYATFGDWLLVIAAYNTGPGNVQKAIKKSGSHNFWDLQYYLPAESRNHVKKFIGTHYIFEGQGGLTTLTKAEAAAYYGKNVIHAVNRTLEPQEKEHAKTQRISGKYQSVVIAKYTMMDMVDFNRYNPDFDKIMAGAKNTYELSLPADKMQLFNTNKYQILNESIQWMLMNASMMKKVSALQAKAVSPKKQVKK